MPFMSRTHTHTHTTTHLATSHVSSQVWPGLTVMVCTVYTVLAVSLCHNRSRSSFVFPLAVCAFPTRKAIHSSTETAQEKKTIIYFRTAPSPTRGSSSYTFIFFIVFEESHFCVRFFFSFFSLLRLFLFSAFMRKRERSELSDNQPAQRSSRRARHEAVSPSSSLSSLSDSVEIVHAMPSDNTAGSQSSASEGSQPSTQPTSAPRVDTLMDPHLERQMNELGLDNDFRDSIRALSPNTQREVLNDIVRNHQMEQIIAEAEHSGGLGFHGLGEESEDVEEDRDDDESDETEVVAPHPGTVNGFDFLQMLLGGGGGGGGSGGGPSRAMMPGMRAVAVDAEGREIDVNPIAAMLMQAMMSGNLGGSSGRAQGLEAFFNNLATEAEQIDAMRRMGMTQDLDDMSYEQLLELEERMGSVSKGLRPAEIAACVAPMSTRPSDGACPICLESWVPSGDESRPSSAPSSVARDEAAVELKHCHHVFHDACIRQWLHSSKQCPVCCQDVIEGTHNTAFASS